MLDSNSPYYAILYTKTNANLLTAHLGLAVGMREGAPKVDGKV